MAHSLLKNLKKKRIIVIFKIINIVI
jgi:hypothetical protein